MDKLEIQLIDKPPVTYDVIKIPVGDPSLALSALSTLFHVLPFGEQILGKQEELPQSTMRVKGMAIMGDIRIHMKEEYTQELISVAENWNGMDVIGVYGDKKYDLFGFRLVSWGYDDERWNGCGRVDSFKEILA